MPVTQSFWEGTPVTITETFYVGTTPTDPTTVTFRLRNPDGTVTSYVFGTDPEVTNPSVGVYVLSLPGTLDPWTYNYRVESTGAVVAVGEGEFTILPSPTLGGDLADPGPVIGPCSQWVDAESVAAACQVTLTEENVADFDFAAVAASMLLFELSGEQFSGPCERLVRPCGSNDGCGWSWSEVLSPSEASNWAVSWMVGVAGWGWYVDEKPLCGCRHIPRVTLGNYPVTNIVEVQINGVVVDPTTYVLRDWRHLDRVTPSAGDETLVWPQCQNMNLPLGEIGTWSVEYTFGVAPPVPGVLAARQLACEVYKFLSTGECALPDGVTALTRQGVTMNRAVFMKWAIQDGQWSTGLTWVDGFLAAYNPVGARRRSAVWSPDLEQYPSAVDA